MSYPTPPPTNSPKHSTVNQQSYDTYSHPPPILEQDHSPNYQQQPNYQPYPHPLENPPQQDTYSYPPPIQEQPTSYQQQPSYPSYQTYPPPPQNPPQDTYPPPTHTASYPQQAPQLPAQETYFHSYSAPTSPIHDPAIPSQYAPQNPSDTFPAQGNANVPYRRRSSPAPSPFTHKNGGGKEGYFRPPSPPRRERSPGNPNYYTSSPLPSISSPKPYTPYNASRPQPRPGFTRRIKNKIVAMIRAFMRWSKRNPIFAGVLTFIPLLTVTAVAKIARVAGKGLGLVDKGHKRPNSNPSPQDSLPGLPGEGEKGILDAGWGFEQFKGFGGSKGGPLEGVLKMLQMMVNHYCKLTPSMYPRAASIMLELWLLEKGK